MGRARQSPGVLCIAHCCECLTEGPAAGVPHEAFVDEVPAGRGEAAVGHRVVVGRGSHALGHGLEVHADKQACDGARRGVVWA